MAHDSDRTPMLADAIMLDREIGEIQAALADRLSWLDVAFGRAQKIVSIESGKRYIRPSVYCGYRTKGQGKNDYIDVLPDSKIGNFCFFEARDPQELEPSPWIRRITAPISIIFWFDMRRIFGRDDYRNTERVKAQILKVLGGRDGWVLPFGRLTINRTYEETANIYRGYTLDEVDAQCMIHPFAGIRFDGVLEFNEVCE